MDLTCIDEAALQIKGDGAVIALVDGEHQVAHTGTAACNPICGQRQRGLGISSSLIGASHPQHVQCHHSLVRPLRKGALLAKQEEADRHVLSNDGERMLRIRMPTCPKRVKNGLHASAGEGFVVRLQMQMRYEAEIRQR